MMDILGALTVVKQTLDISKDLRSIDGKISDAEFKLKIADLVERVLELREALMDAQEREYNLRNEIAALKANASKRASLKDTNGLLYEINEAGEHIGEPFCNLCFAKEEKQIRMRHHAATQSTYACFRCDNCKTVVRTGPSLPRQTQSGRGDSWLR
jgi:hypothetical protein